MKKAGLLFITILSISVVIAQNTSIVTQMGNENTGIVLQTGDLNTGLITSVGDKNKDDVTKWRTWPNGVSALMLAKGIKQVGNENVGDIMQTGSRQEAGIAQIGDNNNAAITQNDPSLGAWGQNAAFVDQLGDLNLSIQNQQGKANNSYFRQLGNSNRAESQQIDNYTGFTIVEQIGNGNKSYQYQEYSAGWEGGNNATANQRGNLNDARQEQHGIENNASITQQGHSNTADQYASGDDNDAQTVVAGSGNTVDQDAIGNNNFSYLAASNNTDDNMMKSYQSGDNNYVNSRIYGTNADGSDNNDLDISQDGTGNKSTNKVRGNSNELDVIQKGSGNIAGTNNVNWGIIQDGDSNEADIYQDGLGNVAKISQTGDSNVGSISSIGDGHSGIIIQTGGMNQAVITQN